MNQTALGASLLGVSIALLVSSIYVPDRVKDVWNNAFYTFMSSGLAVLSPDLRAVNRTQRKPPTKGPQP